MREKVIKRSRDVTIASKRLIFLLHRIQSTATEAVAQHLNTTADALTSSLDNSADMDFDTPSSISTSTSNLSRSTAPTTPEELLLRTAEEEAEQIRDILSDIAVLLGQHDCWRFHRQYSPGLEEYIEAVSFLHYLRHSTLITREQIESDLKASLERYQASQSQNIRKGMESYFQASQLRYNCIQLCLHSFLLSYQIKTSTNIVYLTLPFRLRFWTAL